MQKKLKQLIPKPRILKAVIVFLVSYIIFSVIWVQIKDVYGYGITVAASKFVAELKDARIVAIIRRGDLIIATFGSMNRVNPVLVNVQVKVFAFAFNVPIIMSALASLYPFLKRRKRAYAEALLILLLIHILYVIFLGVFQLTDTYMIKGIEAVSILRLSIYKFLLTVTSYACVSFVPFLIVIYTFVRFRK